MHALSLGIAVAAIGLAGGGGALLLRGRAVLAAMLLTGTGLTGLAGSVLISGHADLGWRAVALGFGLLAPLALATYPTPRWRHPVDFVALVVLLGAGIVTTLWLNTGIAGLDGLVQGCALIAHTWWRIEITRDRERRALVWMTLAVSSIGLVFALVSFASTDDVVLGVGVALFAAVGPAMYVGATLPDLVDVRGLVVSVVVFAVAAITTLSLFVLTVSLLQEAGADQLSVGAMAIVAALVAAAFHPTQVILRGVVDQLLFGERPDPLGAASAVAGRIGDDPVPALRAIRESLVVPYAALLVGGQPIATSGTETTHTRTLDLDGAGELVVGLRPGDLGFSAGDDQVLRLVRPLLAQTLRSRALTEDLIQSRGQTIAAVEEERRRLRRELHDGLGPRLSGVAFTSDAARNLIRTDPAAAEAMVAQLRADTVIAIEEIRRMVYAMRPPALDELGLVPALRQQTAGLRNRQGQPVAVEITAPEALTELPAAVEVAAYRIVVEALTNVARHSGSPAASVCLEPGSHGLRIEVTDSGGDGLAWRPGVGLASMRERASELGGTLEAGPAAAGGRVTAVLPLAPR